MLLDAAGSASPHTRFGIIRHASTRSGAGEAEKAVYVLHVFQKKSPSGVRTARTDVALIEQRLEQAKLHYEATYGEKKD